tara:strand:- start:359 stop:1585 length:1227 start_codon:yes stop_codon:yes gene_type:complete
MSECRHCHTKLNVTFVDLGVAPPSNSYLSKTDILNSELYYPLRVLVCEHCWLVQTHDFVSADKMFEDEYAYFSSTSTSWLMHAEHYSEMIVNRLNLNKNSFVIELASNDGYLLKNFINKKIPCLGIEPSLGTANAAKKLGIDVISEFFTEKLSNEILSSHRKANLIIGNNVFAHVPDINDFTRGMKNILAPDGTITLEFPHLLNLLKYNQFDTIYHEHFSYLSLTSTISIFREFGLKVFDVEQIETHGGSLRVYGCHYEDSRNIKKTVSDCLSTEEEFGLTKINTYISFQSKINQIKNNFLGFLVDSAASGKKVAAYGAAAKGNTLLNFSGIKTDLIDFVSDASEAKQGKYLPGSHIPIYSPSILNDAVLDYLVILPWNLSEEISSQLGFLKNKGVKFVTAIPNLRIF